MSVVVYSQGACPGCTTAKAQLSKAGIPFAEKRVDLDGAAKAFILGRGHRSVPVIYLGDQHFISAAALIASMT